MDNLQLEGQAFDNQIEERINNGHVPDLRRLKPCDYFYNNPWRHPDYVKLDMQEQFELINSKIVEYYDGKKDLKILEVGCGPGYLSLELSREGYDVVGVDVSEKVIEIARQYADEDPWKAERGSINYYCKDFMTLIDNDYDVIVFLGALHHFAEQDKILKKAKNLLKNSGIIIVHEPTRDRVTMTNAGVMLLIKALLNQADGYYEDIFSEGKSFESLVNETYNELKYEDVNGEKVQSVNDNEAGYEDMIGALNGNFVEYHFEERYALFHEIIGGLRFNQEDNKAFSKLIHDLDYALCKMNILQSTEFFYVGRKV